MNCDQPSEHPKSRDRPGDVPLELPRLSTGRMSLGLSGSVPGTMFQDLHGDLEMSLELGKHAFKNRSEFTTADTV